MSTSITEAFVTHFDGTKEKKKQRKRRGNLVKMISKRAAKKKESKHGKAN